MLQRLHGWLPWDWWWLMGGCALRCSACECIESRELAEARRCARNAQPPPDMPVAMIYAKNE